jgi:membrane-associated phospholipid phosphatase
MNSILRILALLVMQGVILPGFSQNADINLLRKLNSTNNSKADNFFDGVGFSVTPISITVPVSFFTIGAIKKNDAIKINSYKQASAIVLSSLISVSLKYTIKRDRPYETYSFITRRTNEHTPSFPSGHTTTAFATATILTLQYPKWQVAVPAYLWASVVAYSRMRLGVHYPSDVLGGILIGTGSSFLVHKLSKKINLASKKTVPLE